MWEQLRAYINQDGDRLVHAIVLVHPPQPGYISSDHLHHSVPWHIPSQLEIHDAETATPAPQHITSLVCVPRTHLLILFLQPSMQTRNSDQNIFSYICAGNPNEARAHAGPNVGTWSSLSISRVILCLFFSWATC